MVSENILVVDDESRMRKLIKDFLAQKGYSILEAADGEEALQIFEENQNKINLILLDVMMPKINGYKICRLLKYDSKYKNIPVIMVTARSQEEDREIGEETGADEYITKPFEFNDIVEAIDRYIK